MPASASTTPISGASYLSDGLYCAAMPRLSPDGRVLAFISVPQPFSSHATNVELRTMSWPASAASSAREARVVVPKLANPITVDGSSFSGFCGFHPQLDALTWLGGPSASGTVAQSLVFPSINFAEFGAFACHDTDPTSSTPPSLPRCLRPPGWTEGSVELLAASHGTVVVQCSALHRPAQVWVCAVDTHEEQAGAKPLHSPADAWALVVDNADTSSLAPVVPTSATELDRLVATLGAARVSKLRLPEAQGGGEALLVLPTEAEGGKQVPWVLRLHGGPHSSAINAFSIQDALLLASGVALLLPNYRGSIGYGDHFSDALLGHIGSMDVDDCAALLRLALEQKALDPARGACYGGSHGGFLTAWLLGSPQHKSLFHCGALWNPVVDLPSMLGTTDIPEWCAAEAYGALDLKRPVSQEQMARLQAASPISVVDQVSVPVLMLLGLGDKRVPPSQGRYYVASLCELPHRPEVSCLEYPGEGHAIAGTESQAHAVQSVVSWLLDHLGIKPNEP